MIDVERYPTPNRCDGRLPVPGFPAPGFPAPVPEPGPFAKIPTPSRSGSRTSAHTLALEAAKIILPMALRVPGSLKSVADQLIRSASSVALNLAESEGRIGRQRINSQRIAYSEALEASTAIELLISAGVIDSETAAKALDLLD